MTEFLPCPHCGSDDIAPITFKGCNGDVWDEFVACGGCGATAETAEAWNMRATGGTLTAEQVRKAIFNGSSYASYDGAQYYANGIDMQAIADELNSRAERTCKPLGTIRYDYEGGYAGYEYETELSCGHKWRDAYGDYPDYCPNCGRKVEP